MTPAAELLDLIIDYAPRLRAAGIASVSVEGASFTLLPEVISDERDVVVIQEDDPDPLNDPLTFGRRAGVPSLKRGDS